MSVSVLHFVVSPLNSQGLYFCRKVQKCSPFFLLLEAMLKFFSGYSDWEQNQMENKNTLNNPLSIYTYLKKTSREISLKISLPVRDSGQMTVLKSWQNYKCVFLASPVCCLWCQRGWLASLCLCVAGSKTTPSSTSGTCCYACWGRAASVRCTRSVWGGADML